MYSYHLRCLCILIGGHFDANLPVAGHILRCAAVENAQFLGARSKDDFAERRTSQQA